MTTHPGSPAEQNPNPGHEDIIEMDEVAPGVYEPVESIPAVEPVVGSVEEETLAEEHSVTPSDITLEGIRSAVRDGITEGLAATDSGESVGEGVYDAMRRLRDEDRLFEEEARAEAAREAAEAARRAEPIVSAPGRPEDRWPVPPRADTDPVDPRIPPSDRLPKREKSKPRDTLKDSLDAAKIARGAPVDEERELIDPKSLRYRHEDMPKTNTERRRRIGQDRAEHRRRKAEAATDRNRTLFTGELPIPDTRTGAPKTLTGILTGKINPETGRGVVFEHEGTLHDIGEVWDEDMLNPDFARNIARNNPHLSKGELKAVKEVLKQFRRNHRRS